MRILQEWAKQLALLGFGDSLDFAKMKVFYIQNGTITYRIPIVPPIEAEARLMDFFDPYFDYETIEMNMFFDPWNKETTRIGYGPITNTLVVGETRFVA
jgi:hypothetical protein